MVIPSGKAELSSTQPSVLPEVSGSCYAHAKLKRCCSQHPMPMYLCSAISRLTAWVLAGICCADTVGTHVLHCLCQKEAQDAIDPIGMAVNKFRVLAYTCRI